MPHVSVTIERYVATLTLDPPGGLATRAFVEDLAAAAADVAALTDEVRAVIVTSAGGDFCTGWGADLLDAPAAALDAGAGFEALAAVPQPVIAAIDGRAYSAGLELALAADVRIAAEGARFAMPDVAEGRVTRCACSCSPRRSTPPRRGASASCRAWRRRPSCTRRRAPSPRRSRSADRSRRASRKRPCTEARRCRSSRRCATSST
jgi:hypothetical protein